MIKGLHHNAYRCRDSEETRAFYEDFLGLRMASAFEINEGPLRLLGKDGVWPRPRLRSRCFPGEDSGAGADHRAGAWGYRVTTAAC